MGSPNIYSRRMKQELNFDCFIWELDRTAVGSVNYACIQQSSDVTVHSFRISAYSAGGFANRDWSRAAKRL